MKNKKIVIMFRNAAVNKFLDLTKWKITNNLVKKLVTNDYKFLTIQLFCAFWDMLDYLIPDNHPTPLRQYVTRDETKIFIIISLLEAITSINDKDNEGNRRKVSIFLNKYFSQDDKDEIEAKTSKININNKEKQVKFNDFVFILYEIRSNFTHRGEYINQFFYHPTIDTTNNFHKYQYESFTFEKTSNKKSTTTKHIHTSLTYKQFENMIIRSIRNYLIEPKKMNGSGHSPLNPLCPSPKVSIRN